MTGPGQFTFLNAPGNLAAGWDPPDASKLWRYHLHYFDDLNAEDADARRTWHLDAIQRWLDANPPAAGTGWEPYPTSLRIVNWVLFDLRTGALPARARDSLAVQARWLTRRLERHLLGNHLLANAKGLVAAGLYFDGPEARRLYRLGQRLLDREIGEQVLADGGHFERSPMYHLVVLQDLLDLAHLHRVYSMGVPVAIDRAVPAMLAWSAAMRHPDGGIPFFNDATFGLTPTPPEIDVYAERLGYPPVTAPGPGAHLLAASGFVRLAYGRMVAFADVGSLGPSYLPGHAHAETLALELSADAARVLVNTGVSQYGTDQRRAYERGTAAHNALVLDGRDSSEVWAGFRVGRRARAAVIERQDDPPVVTARHDGYRTLRGRPTHTRKIRLDETGLQVDDRLCGRGWHSVTGFWHLAPAVCTPPSDGAPIAVESAEGVRLCDGALRLRVTGASDTRLEHDGWHPAMGRTLASARLRFELRDSLPIELRTTLLWERAS